MNPSKGVILYHGKYGGTCQYAQWIAETTGLPLFDLRKDKPDLRNYDFFILGSAIYIGRFAIRHWLTANWKLLHDKPVLLFSVSGTAPDHPDLKTYFEQSFEPTIRQAVDWIPLRGRLDLQKLPWFLRLMLKWVGKHQEDEEARQRMTEGFDFVERKNIEAVIDWAEEQMGVAAD